MKILEVFEAYKKSHFTKSLVTFKGKIKKYISFVGNEDISSALEEKKLREFIFDTSQSPQGKYDALLNFYNFYYQEILKIPKRGMPKFPIANEEAKPIKSDIEPTLPVYLERGFNFNQFFDDKYYEHLDCKNVALMVKTALSLALLAGYDTGQMSPTNKRKALMTINDVLIEDDYIKVRNFYTQSTVPWILIRGKNSDYIKEYYEIRKSYTVKHYGEEENFIAQIWDTKEVNFDKRISTRRPYSPYELVNYMLKYISNEINCPVPNITDLRSNMVLHSLYNTKGAALQDIIELYGFLPFVQNAFMEYCIQMNRDTDSYFSVLSLDNSPPLEQLEHLSESNFVEEKKKNESREIIINRLIRDTTKVKLLKKLYNNCCQICNEQITFLEEIFYSEVHHIQPFNHTHSGIDDIPNMLVLCPNHHKIFDMGIIALDPENHNIILHIDSKNKLHNTKLRLNKHKLSSTCIRYHYENIFLNLKLKLNL